MDTVTLYILYIFAYHVRLYAFKFLANASKFAVNLTVTKRISIIEWL